jgi:hypothetical protein
MATEAANTSLPTLLDAARLKDPDGKQAKVIALLQGRNALLEDAVAVECNRDTGYQWTVDTELPSVEWRPVNAGVAPSKGTSSQMVETCGLLETSSQVDIELLKLGNNEQVIRFDQARKHLTAMNRELERALVYESQKDHPERLTGFIPRYTSLSQNWHEQIISSQISHSGSDGTSVIAVCWGPDSCHLIYPKGTVGGVEHKDMGEQRVTDAAGKRLTVKEDVWTARLGLAIPDPRFVAVLRNIDTGAIAKTGKLLIEDMISLQEQIEDEKMGRCAFYCNRLVRTYLRLQTADTVAGAGPVHFDEIGGKKVLMFGGWPVRRSDEILNTESYIS